ncbi:MAG: bifunctional metallophosphatase/5'-nucleotidase [Telluria sp.]
MTVSLRAPAPLSRAALAAAISLSLAGCATTASREPVTINIVAMNDFHGNLEASRYTPTGLDGAKGQPIRAGGAEAVAAALQAWRKEDKELLFVAAGDLIGASPAMSSLWADEPTIEALNMLGLHASAAGNHEFDAGRKELLRQQHGGCDSPRPNKACQMAPNFGGARFTWLAANVVDSATGKPFIPAYRIEQTRGIKVGLVGAVLQDTQSVVMASGIAGLSFGDEAEAINRAIPAVRAEGADVIVVLVHEGGTTKDNPMTPGCTNLQGPIVDIVKKLDPAVRLVITGHTHQGYLCKVGDRTVTQASSYGHLLTRIAMKVQKGAVGNVGDIKVENVLMKVGDYPPDEKMAAFVAKVKEGSRAALSRPIARLGQAPVLRKRNEAGEAPLGSLIADAVLAATRNQGAQIGFMNEGGIRKDLEAGEGNVATFGQTQAVLPFGNTLVVMDLSGAQLRALLEQQWRAAGGGSMLQVSNGFSYTWDAKRPLGSRVVGMTLNGQPLVDAKSYRIVANNFLAEGGDNFPEFAKGTNRRETGMLDLDAFVDYLRASEGQGAALAPAAPRIIKAQ